MFSTLVRVWVIFTGFSRETEVDPFPIYKYLYGSVAIWAQSSYELARCISCGLPDFPLLMGGACCHALLCWALPRAASAGSVAHTTPPTTTIDIVQSWFDGVFNCFPPIWEESLDAIPEDEVFVRLDESSDEDTS